MAAPVTEIMNKTEVAPFAPADRHSHPASGNGSLDSPEGPPIKSNILLVDDRADKLLAIEAILSSLGQNVVKARSGKEALRYLLHQEFAVILMDVSMPCMDGFETASLIRKRPSSEQTPIIFITSINTSENHIARGYSLGAVDYMLMPLVPEILRSKVSVLVELQKKSELIRRQSEQLRHLEESRHQRQLAEVADRLELETKRNRFFTLSIDLLAIASFDDFFIQLNPVWETTLGFSVDELRSKSLLEFVHPGDRSETAEQLNRLKLGSAPAYFENRCLSRDGSIRWLGWTAAPFGSEQLVYIFARDITSRKASETEIKSLNVELEHRINDLTEINQELEAFGYSISHDMRAPLRSIRSFAQFLREQSATDLPHESRDYLERIERAAKYMDLLLLDLLQYSRLSSCDLELVKVDVGAAVSDVVASIEPEVHERKAEIQVRKGLGSVMAHPATLRQVIYNLVSNSLKFVEHGQTPRIEIWSESRGGVVRIWVADWGIGIPTQYHKKIFGLFQRLHSQDTYPGTGVGLALVRKGLERMGGRIGVESEPGQGTRFWFELREPSQAGPEEPGIGSSN
jgi:PAS domain S-box-containing protein